MMPSFGETFNALLYKRKENSNDYEATPRLTFKCKPMKENEKQSFVLTEGLLTQTRGIYVLATRLPSEVTIDDKIEFLGKRWLVEAVGYFVQNSRTLASSDLSEEEMVKRYPKGIKLV